MVKNRKTPLVFETAAANYRIPMFLIGAICILSDFQEKSSVFVWIVPNVGRQINRVPLITLSKGT